VRLPKSRVLGRKPLVLPDQVQRWPTNLAVR
jgi:hypothetical protein